MNQDQEQDEELLVHSFPRGENDAIHFVLRKYKQRYYIDLRIWYRKDSPQLWPTRKGIVLPVEKLPELKRGLEELDKARVKMC